MNSPRWILVAGAGILFLAGGCAKKPPPQPPAAPAPPAPKQNIFALLPEPDGKTGRIVVSNSGGTQELAQANQAVRIEREDVQPGAPFTLDSDAVRRLFGAALDVLPPAEVRFVLYFDEARDDLNAASLAQLPAILRTIQDRHSTAVTLIGHTDTTGDPQSNYRLGMLRAQRVAAYLRARGVDASSLIVDSHGESDLAVQTPRGQAEPQNRRVEVIVR
jgi:outer membrane protein OmpA-like peptidoglycan-associated protein